MVDQNLGHKESLLLKEEVSRHTVCSGVICRGKVLTLLSLFLGCSFVVIFSPMLCTSGEDNLNMAIQGSPITMQHMQSARPQQLTQPMRTLAIARQFMWPSSIQQSMPRRVDVHVGTGPRSSWPEGGGQGGRAPDYPMNMEIPIEIFDRGPRSQGPGINATAGVYNNDTGWSSESFCSTTSAGVKMPRQMFLSAQIEDRILFALRAGYRGFDMAADQDKYNEIEAGKELAKGMKELNLKREDLFIQTKVSPFYESSVDVAKQVEESIELSIKNIDCFYLDSLILQVDDTSSAMMIQSLKAWAAMEAAVLEGKVRQLGVQRIASAGFLSKLCAESIVKPAVMQVDFDNTVKANGLRAYCENQGITIQAFKCLALIQDLPGSIQGTMMRLADIYIPFEPKGTHIPSVTASTLWLRFVMGFGMVPMTRPPTEEIAAQYTRAYTLPLSLEHGDFFVRALSELTPQRSYYNYENVAVEDTPIDTEALNKIIRGNLMEELEAKRKADPNFKPEMWDVDPTLKNPKVSGFNLPKSKYAEEEEKSYD